jgi:hypothetical protein
VISALSNICGGPLGEIDVATTVALARAAASAGGEAAVLLKDAKRGLSKPDMKVLCFATSIAQAVSQLSTVTEALASGIPESDWQAARSATDLNLAIALTACMAIGEASEAQVVAASTAKYICPILDPAAAEARQALALADLVAHERWLLDLIAGLAEDALTITNLASEIARFASVGRTVSVATRAFAEQSKAAREPSGNEEEAVHARATLSTQGWESLRELAALYGKRERGSSFDLFALRTAAIVMTVEDVLVPILEMSGDIPPDALSDVEDQCNIGTCSLWTAEAIVSLSVLTMLAEVAGIRIKQTVLWGAHGARSCTADVGYAVFDASYLGSC